MHIYKITNLINKKIYIGLSTYDGHERWDKHRYNATKKSNHHLDRAIFKYGKNNFKYQVIEKVPFQKGIKFLESREIHFIHKHKSYLPDIGYNKSLGGNVNVGKVVTDIQRKRVKKSQKNLKVISYDLDGFYLKTYDSLFDAAEDNDVSISAIHHVLNKKNRSSSKKQWRTFLNNKFKKKIEKFNKINTRQMIPIYQWSKEGEFIKKHLAKDRAVKDTGVHLSSINRVLQGLHPFAGGFHWTLSPKLANKPKKKITSGPTEKRKKFINVYNQKGKYLETIKGLENTARKYGVPSSEISKCLVGNKSVQKCKDNKLYQFRKFNGKKTNIKPTKSKPVQPIKVLVYDLSGKFVNIFDNIAAAAKFTKVNRSGVRRSANNENYRAKNHMCRWYKGKILKKIKSHIDVKTKVLQYDFEGNFIREYNSIIEAAKRVNVRPNNIRKCVIGRGYSSSGFYWFEKKNKKVEIKIPTPVPHTK